MADDDRDTITCTMTHEDLCRCRRLQIPMEMWLEVVAMNRASDYPDPFEVVIHLLWNREHHLFMIEEIRGPICRDEECEECEG